VALDYAAVQPLKSVARQTCSRDKCIFLMVVSVFITSFGITLGNFGYSFVASDTNSGTSLQTNIAKLAGQVFLVSALIVVLSHVVLPRSMQLKLCASHVTNVLTRNRRAPKGTCKQYVVLFWFALLLILDLSISLYLLLIYGTLQDNQVVNNKRIGTSDYTAFMLVLCVYPFAYVASPIIGLMSLLFWLPFWIKRFIEWNLGSILSACVSVLMYLW
jgi:hypothetical protein